MDINISTSELSELISDIYEAALTAKWNDVLDKIIHATDSNKALIIQNFTEEKPPILSLQSDVEYPHQALVDYQQRLHEDPFYQNTKNEPAGKCINCNEYVDINLHLDSDYYQNVLIPMKTHYVLVTMLHKDGIHDSVFILNRGNDQTPYTIQEENLINMLTPHLSRAMYVFKELRLYKDYSNISKSIIDQDDKAIIVCDQNGKVIISNQYANDRLIESCQVVIGQNRLEIRNKVYQQQIDYFIEQCAKLAYKDIGTQETLIIESDEENNENLLITVSPLINKSTFNDITVPCCLVTINFQQQLNWENLEQEFQLTPKELQLLKAIHSKKKLNQLTSVFNVSYNTLRTHLQAIFRKVAVNSQTELMVKINLFK